MVNDNGRNEKIFLEKRVKVPARTALTGFLGLFSTGAGTKTGAMRGMDLTD